MADEPAVPAPLPIEVNVGYPSGPPEAPAAPPSGVPAALAGQVRGATWEQVWVKEGSEVWRLDGLTGERYLKITAAGGHDGTTAEAERLRWLTGRSPLTVPDVLAHVVEGDVGDRR